MQEDDVQALRIAVKALEHPRLAARLAEIAGKPIEPGREIEGTIWGHRARRPEEAVGELCRRPGNTTPPPDTAGAPAGSPGAQSRPIGRGTAKSGVKCATVRRRAGAEACFIRPAT